MSGMIENMKKRGILVKNYLFRYKRFFLWNYVFSAILYFSLMSHSLVNHNDGIWKSNWFVAGNWELSIGRWFWTYLDKIRFGIQCEPFNTLITVTLIITGNLLLVDLFSLLEKKASYVVSFLFLSSTVVCVSLSYRYMSPTFGMAYLLSMAAAYCVIRTKSIWKSVLLGGLLIACSMGCYQAYLGCTCLVLLSYLLYQLKEKLEGEKIVQYCLKSVLSVLCGGVLYRLLLEVHLRIHHVSMSDYQSAASISITGILKNLPTNIVNTYKEFYHYFLGTTIKSNIFQMHPLLMKLLVCALILIFVLGSLNYFRKVGMFQSIFYLLICALFPVACNVVLLIAPYSSTSVQMTGALALFFPCLLCMIANFEFELLYLRKLLVSVAVILNGLLLYGNIYMTVTDQDAMLEGKNATITLTNQILGTLGEAGYLREDFQYAFLGAPASNPFFYKSQLFKNANDYARFGDWFVQPIGCSRMSWDGVLENDCGVNLNFCNNENLETVIGDDNVKNMPVYPADGSIVLQNNIVIVKVANYY